MACSNSEAWGSSAVTEGADDAAGGAGSGRRLCRGGATALAGGEGGGGADGDGGAVADDIKEGLSQRPPATTACGADPCKRMVTAPSTTCTSRVIPPWTWTENTVPVSSISA